MPSAQLVSTFSLIGPDGVSTFDGPGTSLPGLLGRAYPVAIWVVGALVVSGTVWVWLVGEPSGSEGVVVAVAELVALAGVGTMAAHRRRPTDRVSLAGQVGTLVGVSTMLGSTAVVPVRALLMAGAAATFVTVVATTRVRAGTPPD